MASNYCIHFIQNSHS